MNYNPFDIFGSFMNGENTQTEQQNNDAESEMAQRWKEQNGKKEKTPMSRKKKILLIVLAVLVLLFLVSDRILRFVMDIWHVSEIGAGFTDIFWKNVLCRLAVFGAGFLLVFVVTLANSFLLRKLAFRKHLEGKIWEKRWPYLLFSLLFSLLFGGVMGENTYAELLTALHATDFGVVDPMFGKDVGYYIFVRPFFQHMIGAFKSIFILQAVLVAIVYFAVFSVSGIRKIRDMIKTQTGAVSHVLVNVLFCYLAMFFT